MTLAIDIRETCVGWASRRLMSKLELCLVEGETLVIVGPGGSGKSTTLRVIEQAVNGRDKTSDDDALWWRGTVSTSVSRCSRLRQHGAHDSVPILDVLASLGLDTRDDWMPRGERERNQLAAAYPLNLGDAPQHLRRFLSFVLVAYSDAPLLLFDEPCFALRGPWRDAVRARIATLARERRTMVVVTHHLIFARAIADQVMLMVDGQTIESGDALAFFDHPTHLRTRQYLKWGA